MQRSFASAALLAVGIAGLAGITALPLPARAESATLLRDINPSQSAGSFPGGDFLTAGGKLFFIASSPLGEPAVADGNGTGSMLLADLCAGSCDSQAALLGSLGDAALLVAYDGQENLLYRSDGTRAGTYALGGPVDRSLPGRLALAGDRLYFLRLASQAAEDLELWVSDGTVAGTRAVRFPAGSSPLPERLVPVGRRVFFRDIHNPGVLWVSDGTLAGTRAVHDFGTDGPEGLTAGATRLYFLTPAGTAWQLWTSDGSAAGTLPLDRFFPNPGNAEPVLETVGDRVYLTSDDLVHGQEIWTSDGTPGAARRVTEIDNPEPFGSVVPPLAELGARLVFETRDGLWASAGTPGSTTLLVKATPRSNLVRAGKRVLFQGAGESGVEVWATDGTAAGTARVKTACPGPCGTPEGLAPFPGQDAALLVGREADGVALFLSDGTNAGTHRYSDPEPGVIDLTRFAAVGRQIFFFSRRSGNVFTLWTSDGRPGGTHPVPGFPAGNDGSFPSGFTAFGGRLLFTACDGTNRQVWQSDGTPAGTTPFLNLPADRSPCFGGAQRLTPAGDRLFFWFPTPDFSAGWQLWQSDGAGNARELPAIDSFQSPSPQPLLALGGEVFFFLPKAGGGAQLFRSDGTAAGTREATELAAVPSPILLAEVDGGLLFLLAGDPAPGHQEIWASDGTAAGTRRIAGPLSLSSHAGPPFLLPAGSRFYFLLEGSTPPKVTEVWSTDGTAVGTALVTRLPAEVSSPAFVYPAVLGEALYLFANATGGRGLYRVDASGAILLRQFGRQEDPGPFGTFSFPTVFAGRLFFAADDGVHGRALWATDGTAAGTVLVRQIGPLPGPSRLSQLTVAGGRLFFTAWDLAHGEELWESDGTTAGTHLAADVAPERASASPDRLTAVGGHLFFAADDGLTGRELWSFPLSGGASCQPGETRLCLAGQRFQVEVAWRDFQGRTGVGHAVPLTADTGYFWFFDPANVETVVKVLDARALNQAFWVFYGALSNVEYEITVTDTQTGLARRYVNPAGQLASVGDTAGFGPLGAYDGKVAARTDARAATGPCTPGARRLCLNGGRFAVEASWKDFQGKTGTGTAVALSADTGYFWFFAPANVEVMTKVLDGTGLNGKFWFFYGALSNVEYTLTVTDTRTGAVKTYKNPSGQFGSLADTGAF